MNQCVPVVKTTNFCLHCIGKYTASRWGEVILFSVFSTVERPLEHQVWSCTPERMDMDLRRDMDLLKQG